MCGKSPSPADAPLLVPETLEDLADMLLVDGLLPDVLLPDVLPPDVLPPDVLPPDVLLPDVLLPDVLLPDRLLPDRLLLCPDTVLLCPSRSSQSSLSYSSSLMSLNVAKSFAVVNVIWVVMICIAYRCT